MARVHVPGPYAPLWDRDPGDGDEGDDAVLTVIVVNSLRLCVENGRSRDSAFTPPRPPSLWAIRSLLTWGEPSPCSCIFFFLSSSLLIDSRSTRKEKRVKILEHVLKTLKAQILLKTWCQWSANTSVVSIISHLELHLSQKRWYRQIKPGVLQCIKPTYLHLKMYCNGLFFFPWTDAHGNRWCAFATENTLFIYEQKDRKPKTEQLYIEKTSVKMRSELWKSAHPRLLCSVSPRFKKH